MYRKHDARSNILFENLARKRPILYQEINMETEPVESKLNWDEPI
jgi:hypothetical protein